MHYYFPAKKETPNQDSARARNYGSNMGRFISPDSLSLTEERLEEDILLRNKRGVGDRPPCERSEGD